MKKYLITLLIIPTLIFADAVIFSGSDVKTLKPNIDLFGVAKILTTSTIPTAGLTAPKGSIAMYTTTGDLYLKTGALNTDWTKNQTGPVNLTTDVTGVLPIANGGTGSATQNFVDLTTVQTVAGAKTFTGTPTAFTPGASVTAATSRFLFTGASDTALTASTEAPNVYFNMSQTRQHSTGTLSTQRDFRITPSTHSFVGASTLTNAAALSIDGPSNGGANATLTKSSAIYVPTSALTNVTNSYGVNVAATTGATNNYAAAFTGGSVGIGTTAPASLLHTLENNSATGNSNGLTVEQAGTGDATQHFLLTAGQRYTMGIDNSDSDKFKIGTNADLGTSNLVTLTSTGMFGIGTASPSQRLSVLGSGASSPTSGTWVTSGAPLASLYGETTIGNMDLLLGGASDTNIARPVVVGRKARNTLASPSALATGDQILSMLASGYDGTNFLNHSSIDFLVNGAVSAATLPIDIAFNTGSTARTERLRITSSGNVGIGTAAPGTLIHAAITNSTAYTPTSAALAIPANILTTIENLDTTDSTASLLSFVSRSGAAVNRSFIGNVSNTAGGSIVFGHRTGTTAYAERMRIDYLGNLGIGTSSPNANAILDVTSTTKAFMPPRMTTAQKNAIASPTAGMVVYDTDMKGISFYNGTAWTTTNNKNVATKTANYTALQSDDVIRGDATSGAITITLPTAVGNTGEVFHIKKIDSSVNAVTIATTSSQTIDGVTTQTLGVQYKNLTVVSNGTSWDIL